MLHISYDRLNYLQVLAMIAQTALYLLTGKLWRRVPIRVHLRFQTPLPRIGDRWPQTILWYRVLGMKKVPQFLGP
jgi:hypothetical protein